MSSHGEHVDQLARLLDYADEASIIRFYDRLIATQSEPELQLIASRLCLDVEALRKARATVRETWPQWITYPR